MKDKNFRVWGTDEFVLTKEEVITKNPDKMRLLGEIALKDPEFIQKIVNDLIENKWINPITRFNQ